MSREAICPMCGEPLSVSVENDEKAGGIKIVLFCEGADDDTFGLEILTGLRNRDLKKLRDVREVVPKEMKIRVTQYESDPCAE